MDEKRRKELEERHHEAGGQQRTQHDARDDVAAEQAQHVDAPQESSNKPPPATNDDFTDEQQEDSEYDTLKRQLQRQLQEVELAHAREFERLAEQQQLQFQLYEEQLKEQQQSDTLDDSQMKQLRAQIDDVMAVHKRQQVELVRQQAQQLTELKQQHAELLASEEIGHEAHDVAQEAPAHVETADMEQLNRLSEKVAQQEWKSLDDQNEQQIRDGPVEFSSDQQQKEFDTVGVGADTTEESDSEPADDAQLASQLAGNAAAVEASQMETEPPVVKPDVSTADSDHSGE